MFTVEIEEVNISGVLLHYNVYYRTSSGARIDLFGRSVWSLDLNDLSQRVSMVEQAIESGQTIQ